MNYYNRKEAKNQVLFVSIKPFFQKLLTKCKSFDTIKYLKKRLSGNKYPDVRLSESRRKVRDGR